MMCRTINPYRKYETCHQNNPISHKSNSKNKRKPLYHHLNSHVDQLLQNCLSKHHMTQGIITKPKAPYLGLQPHCYMYDLEIKVLHFFDFTSGRTSSRFCVEQNIDPEGSWTNIRNVRQILASTNSHGAGPVSTNRTANTLSQKITDYDKSLEM
jgi:hypothetical protein